MATVLVPRSGAVLLVVLALASSGCSRAESSPTSSGAAPDPATSGNHAAGPGSSSPLVLAPGAGIRFVKAGSGDVAPLVKAEREKVAADGRELIVYVGAKWCEPCQRFHKAAQAGELDADFPNLTILEFDLDEDRDRIVAAGYKSKLIPLFVRPESDGRASTRRFEGGVKGERAVTNITPRLRQLVDK
jgi:thiol-disulfide isomerase/thioredoxin